MAKKKNKKSKELSGYEKRRLRTQRIIFIGIGVVIILSMLISLVGNVY
jgi:predicted nucleic acid-binding Zn ribbon protein